MKKIIEALWPINCRYNFKVSPDGKCHSTTCMMNQDGELKDKIVKEGCLCFQDEAVLQSLRKAAGLEAKND